MASRLLLGRPGRRIKEERPGPAEEETAGRFGVTEYVGRDRQRRDQRAMDAAKPGEDRRGARDAADDDASDVGWLAATLDSDMRGRLGLCSVGTRNWG